MRSIFWEVGRMVSNLCDICNNKINENFSLVIRRESRIDIVEGVIQLLFVDGEVTISSSKLSKPFTIKAGDLNINYMEEENLFYFELEDSKNKITYTIKQKRDLDLVDLESNEVIVDVIADNFTLAHYNISNPDFTENDGVIHITSEDTDNACSFFIKDIEKIYIENNTEEIQYICLKNRGIMTEIFFIN